MSAQKLKEQESLVQESQEDLKWAESEGERRDLLDGARTRETDPNKMDGDTLVKEAKGVQDKTLDALKRTAYTLGETKEVGLATATTLQQQSDQIKGVTEEMMRINDKLKRADKLLRVFGRRMATDRLILFFTFLVVVGIAAIIIYATVNPDQEQFHVPDEAKPPSPQQVQQDVGAGSG